MTIKDSLYFILNGESSEDYGIYNVNINNDGMSEEYFLSSRNIKEVVTRNNKFYFQEMKYEPLNISLNFAFTETFNDDLLRKTARWLSPSYYVPLQFSENLNKIYYVVSIDEPMLLHNCLKQGYITINFRANTYHAYSPEYLSELYDLSNNDSSGTIIEFINNGDLQVFPEIYLKKVIDSGDISIINLSNGGLEFKFSNLLKNEEIYVNNENKIIETNIANTYRYSSFNMNFLECLYGVNKLKILGKCELQFRWQCKLL